MPGACNGSNDSRLIVGQYYLSMVCFLWRLVPIMLGMIRVSNGAPHVMTARVYG